jgi:hypothetical protein
MKLTQKLRKISANLFYFLAPLILILLTGCPADRICITPTNIQASRLTVAFAEGNSCKKPASNIVEVSFALIDKTKVPIPTIWTIQSKSQDGGKLDKLIYGVIPEGFTQEASALPIHEKDKILVSVMDRYVKGPDIEITLTK